MIKTTYDRPQYNAVLGDRQRIELSRGCPNLCEYCYEPGPREAEIFGIPQLEKNYVEILDMNFLFQPGRDVLKLIRDLGKIRVNGRVVYFEAICGFDYRLMSQEIADALHEARFKKIRFAWDHGLGEQYKLKDTVKMFMRAGYRPRDMMVFIIVNWKISRADCEKKLDLLKVWNVKVGDCCFDGGHAIAKPGYWTAEDIKAFRRKCRKHNHLVGFWIDPLLKVGKL